MADKQTKTTGTLEIQGVSPFLTVNDIEKSLTWYRDVLGCGVGDRWEVDGVLRGVELSAGSTMFMIGQDDWKKGRDRVKGEGVRFYCTIEQDIDEVAKRIKANGGTLSQEPTDHPEWGMRDFALEDPDGYKLTIGKFVKK